MGREVKLVQRVLAAAAATYPARYEHDISDSDQEHAGGALDPDSFEQRERSATRRLSDSPRVREWSGLACRIRWRRETPIGGRLRRARHGERLKRERMYARG